MRAAVWTMSVLLAGCFFEQEYGGVCGDGELTLDEYCDDGNTIDGDDCSSTCEAPAKLCGNGILDPGEECDRNTLLCDIHCRLYTEARVNIEWWIGPYMGVRDRCLSGLPTVSVHAQQLDANGAPVGAEIALTRECYDGYAELVLPFGIYKTWVETTAGATSYVALPALVDVRAIASADVVFDLYLDAGYVRIAWSITDMQNAPIDCAQAGASNVVVLLSGPSVSQELPAPCAQGSLISPVLPFGTVQVQALLVSPNNSFLDNVGPFAVTVSEPTGIHDGMAAFQVGP